MSITGIPSLHDARWQEVDILRVRLAFELGRKQTHHVHSGGAALAGELLYRLGSLLILGQPPEELVDDMARPVCLLLPSDVAGDAAGILYVLLAVEHIPHRGRLLAGWVPQMHGED